MLGNFLLKSISAWPEGIFRGFKRRNSSITKFTTSKFKAQCSFKLKPMSVQPTSWQPLKIYLPALLKWGHLHSECESCFFLWNITFFPFKRNRTHFHQRARRHVLHKKSFVRVKIEGNSKRENHILPSFPMSKAYFRGFLY